MVVSYIHINSHSSYHVGWRAHITSTKKAYVWRFKSKSSGWKYDNLTLTVL